jgi:DDT domain-containing chromatin protein
MYPHFSKYTVQIKYSGRIPREAFFETKDVTRDRRSFSKHLLRSFLKNALSKETWHGAPWVVKEPLAIECELPLEVPPHLQQSARVAEKKALKKAHAEQQRLVEQSMFTITDFRQHPNGRRPGYLPGPTSPPVSQPVWNSKPMGKSKTKFIQHNFEAGAPGHLQNHNDFRYYPHDPNNPHYSPNGNGNVQGFVMYPHDQPPYSQAAVYHHATSLPMHRKDKAQSPPPPPQIKYPIEDMDVPPKETDITRPPLKSFIDLPVAGLESDEDYPTGKLKEESIGPMLEVWNTLNVHSEVFILDSFTLDDFAEALRFSAPDGECELLAEVHCAVLKQLVDSQGKLMVPLPQFEEPSEKDSDEEDSSSAEEEAEEEPEPEPEPQPEPPRRTTRGSLAKAEAEALALAKSPTPEEIAIHHAAELEARNPWRERCKLRDFRNHMWQVVLVGLLYQASLVPALKERCERLLSHLVPPDIEPTDRTVVERYSTLDVNMRLEALEIIVMLSHSTKAIREHLEKMSLEMTDLRKRKIEQQRLKKDL